MKTIIIIDDNEIDLLIIQKMLESHLSNTSFKQFTSPNAALDALKEARMVVDLILLDLDMPIMNGWDFLDELDKFNISIPVYILTCSLDIHEKQKLKASSLLKGFFTKPLLKESILQLASENNLS